MPEPLNARALAVIGRIRRYGDTKRGPITLRYFTAPQGLKIVASDGQFEATDDLPNAQLQGDEGIAKAMNAIESVLQQIRDAKAKASVAR